MTIRLRAGLLLVSMVVAGCGAGQGSEPVPPPAELALVRGKIVTMDPETPTAGARPGTWVVGAGWHQEKWEAGDGR